MCSPRQRAPAADNPTDDIMYSGGGCDEQRRTPHELSIDVLSSTALFLAPARRLRVASVWPHVCALRCVCVRSGGQARQPEKIGHASPHMHATRNCGCQHGEIRRDYDVTDTLNDQSSTGGAGLWSLARLRASAWCRACTHVRCA